MRANEVKKCMICGKKLKGRRRSDRKYCKECRKKYPGPRLNKTYHKNKLVKE